MAQLSFFLRLSRRSWPVSAGVLFAVLVSAWNAPGVARAASLPRKPVAAAADTGSIESLIGPPSSRFT